jgi:hypothetical protein
MAGLDTRIPLGYQAVDWGNSLASGLKVANALRGDQLTPAERERLALAKAEFEHQQQNALADNTRADAMFKWQQEQGSRVDPWEAVQRKLIEGGEGALTPGEQRLLKLHERQNMFGGGTTIQDPDAVNAPPTQGAPETPVSALPPLASSPEGLFGGPSPAAANPVTRQSPASAPPSVPPSLAGKGAQWSPSRQQFRTPDGMIYNRQGIPVSG